MRYRLFTCWAKCCARRSYCEYSIYTSVYMCVMCHWQILVDRIPCFPRKQIKYFPKWQNAIHLILFAFHHHHHCLKLLKFCAFKHPTTTSENESSTFSLYSFIDEQNTMRIYVMNFHTSHHNSQLNEWRALLLQNKTEEEGEEMNRRSVRPNVITTCICTLINWWMVTTTMFTHLCFLFTKDATKFIQFLHDCDKNAANFLETKRKSSARALEQRTRSCGAREIEKEWQRKREKKRWSRIEMWNTRGTTSWENPMKMYYLDMVFMGWCLSSCAINMNRKTQQATATENEWKKKCLCFLFRIFTRIYRAHKLPVAALRTHS